MSNLNMKDLEKYILLLNPDELTQLDIIIKARLMDLDIEQLSNPWPANDSA